MLRLTCPLCGERDHTEFRYGGDASKTRPPHGEARAEVWHDHHFLFDNPKGVHREYWQHILGCRHWMVVERHTVTNAVTGTWDAREHAAMKTGGGAA